MGTGIVEKGREGAWRSLHGEPFLLAGDENRKLDFVAPSSVAQWRPEVGGIRRDFSRPRDIKEMDRHSRWVITRKDTCQTERTGSEIRPSLSSGRGSTASVTARMPEWRDPCVSKVTAHGRGGSFATPGEDHVRCSPQTWQREVDLATLTGRNTWGLQNFKVFSFSSRDGSELTV